jgi:hypothetical protein
MALRDEYKSTAFVNRVSEYDTWIKDGGHNSRVKSNV